MKCNARRSLVAPKFNWPDSRFGYLSSPAKVESSKCLKAPITLSLSREYPCSYDFHVFVFFILHFFTITYSKNQCSFFFFLLRKISAFKNCFPHILYINFFFFWSKCVEVHKQNLVWWSVSKKPNLKIVIQIYCENVKMKTSFKCFSDFGFCVCWVIVWTLLTI